MSEVKRYDLVGDMDGNCNLNEARMELSDDGVYVKHRDYEALEAKCTALAEENALLKDYLAPIGLKVEGTPATDTFMAEVRAQGVEMFGKYHNFSEKLFIQKEAQKFAAQLRKGVDQK